MQLLSCWQLKPLKKSENCFQIFDSLAHYLRGIRGTLKTLFQWFLLLKTYQVSSYYVTIYNVFYGSRDIYFIAFVHERALNSEELLHVIFF